MERLRPIFIRLWSSSVAWSWGLNGLRLGSSLLLLPLLVRLPTPDYGIYFVLLSLQAIVPLLDLGFLPSIDRAVSYAVGGAASIQSHGLVLEGRSDGQPNRALLWKLLHVTRTLYRWLASFSAAGYPGLEPEKRSTIPDSAVLPRKLLDFLRLIKQDENERDTSLPELIRRARLTGVVAQDEAIDRTSVWRTCRRLGLSVTRRRKLAQTDMRRFAYQNRMLMVLADGKHFRAGVRRLRRVAVILLDDATRLGLEVVVGTSEDTALFLSGLHAAITRYGLMKQ